MTLSGGKFEDRVSQLRREYQRRLFWYDVFLCVLAIVVILTTFGAIYLFNLK